MDIEQLRQERITKLNRLIELGLNPYPYKYESSHTCQEVRDQFEELSEKVKVRVAGRLRLIRRMGKASFADIHDASGKIQLYFKLDVLGENEYHAFELLDIGDIIGVEGIPFRTKTGEITIKVANFEILGKSLRPLSDKWKGLRDQETRYRRRYLDLIMNPAVKEVFLKRTAMMNFLRVFLNSRGFIEVETPILQPLYGGALARPFVTHHNTLDMDLYLRIADELYLKRLIIGGFEKVYEVCKDFRNEGIDRIHNPEFTMLELYQAYTDYNDMMALLEEMIPAMAKEVLRSEILIFGEDTIDLKTPWPRKGFYDLVEEYTGWKIIDMTDEQLVEIIEKVTPTKELVNLNRGKLLDLIFSEKVEPHLKGPVFVTDFPIEISPLTKIHRTNPKVVERFELYLFGKEVANAYSELNDPLEQRARFEQQVRWSEAGDGETQPMDEDFLQALEFGMPPTGGMGIGFDRLVMFFCNKMSIRDVILFPQLRPEEMKAKEEYEEE
jgi:lysyl-tRNA synthetase class 2